MRFYATNNRDHSAAIVMAIDDGWKQPRKYVGPVSHETARRITGSPESKERAKQFFKEHDDVLRGRNI